MPAVTRREASLAIASFAAWQAPARAQAYPSKAARIVVPYPPGGGSDLIARMVAPRLADLRKQAVVVDNKAGATGAIATEFVVRSAPDGYTLFFGTTAELAINPVANPKLPFDVQRDLDPVTLLCVSPLAWVAHPSVKAGNAREMLELARKSPGTYSYSSPGRGSPHHFAGEWLKAITGVSLLHVPYKGGGPQLNDLLGGQTHTGFIPLAIAAPYLKTNKLRALGVTSARRAEAFPDIPSLDESGVQGLDLVQWRGLLVPAGTPRPVRQHIHAEVTDVLRVPEIQQKMRDLGEEPSGAGEAEFAALVKADLAKYRRISAQARIDFE